MDQANEPDLLRRCREGDERAFDDLFRHHYAPAVRYAARVSPSLDPEDLTAEAFARIWATIRGGGGPEHAFGQYLRTTIKNLAVNTATRSHEEPSDDDHLDYWLRREAQVAGDGFSAMMAEHEVVAEAFETLPQRWRSVLWMIDVEGRRTSDVAHRLGLSPNGTAALTKRARAALGQAWLTAHLDARGTHPECAWVLDHVSGYARGTLSTTQHERVRRHLDECDSCNRAAHRVGHLATSLRIVAIIAGGSLVGLVAARRPSRIAGLAAAAAVIAVVAFVAGADVVGTPVAVGQAPPTPPAPSRTPAAPTVGPQGGPAPVGSAPSTSTPGQPAAPAAARTSPGAATGTQPTQAPGGAGLPSSAPTGTRPGAAPTGTPTLPGTGPTAAPTSPHTVPAPSSTAPATPDGASPAPQPTQPTQPTQTIVPGPRVLPSFPEETPSPTPRPSQAHDTTEPTPTLPTLPVDPEPAYPTSSVPPGMVTIKPPPWLGPPTPAMEPEPRDDESPEPASGPSEEASPEPSSEGVSPKPSDEATETPG